MQQKIGKKNKTERQETRKNRKNQGAQLASQAVQGSHNTTTFLPLPLLHHLLPHAVSHHEHRVEAQGSVDDKFLLEREIVKYF